MNLAKIEYNAIKCKKYEHLWFDSVWNGEYTLMNNSQTSTPTTPK